MVKMASLKERKQKEREKEMKNPNRIDLMWKDFEYIETLHGKKASSKKFREEGFSSSGW